MTASSLAHEPVQRPEYEYIELALGGIGEHPPELSAIRLASALVVDVLDDNFPPLRLDEPAQLTELVLRVLPSVGGADHGINGRSHGRLRIEGQLFPRAAPVPSRTVQTVKHRKRRELLNMVTSDQLLDRGKRQLLVGRKVSNAVGSRPWLPRFQSLTDTLKSDSVPFRSNSKFRLAGVCLNREWKQIGPPGLERVWSQPQKTSLR
jgi:hypothetical protein